jgi:hypothetical protein
VLGPSPGEKIVDLVSVLSVVFSRRVNLVSIDLELGSRSIDRVATVEEFDHVEYANPVSL